MAGPTRPLAEQLGPLPDGIAALDEEHQQALAEALRAARERQAAELATTAEESLKYVPALLRTAVRKAVGL
ncbi:hypothetical protein [Amycolatopsis cihanbeyliensis]|uniref:Uncharacterized protein n=1 Tax=Amycolatopsis cihanbeyliensis TaxID=1128664 RepID=A0A542DQ55_AMYCI|nr:hypothetical protein [Amycolatopsis cihanbeyliensis]TQJ05186.1 hypothetical protein FB471_5012 [Amycolatopsis cihanbeyliensis]